MDTGSSNTDNITQDGELSGGGDPNAIVTLTEGATMLGTTVADNTGSWSFMPILTDGTHTVVASETNGSGATGTASLTFTLEANAPPMPVTLLNDTGSSPSDNVTSNATLQGSGTPDATVTFMENSTTIGNVTADSNGAWSFTPLNLLDGTHIISAQEVDTAGNTVTGTVTFDLDTTAPDAPAITSPALTDNTLPVITGTAETGSTVTVTVAGAMYTTAATNGTWSLDLSTATPNNGIVSLDPNGPNNLSATATDAAGNVSAATSQTLTVDTTPPAAPVFTSPDLTNTTTPPLITGTAEPGSTVTFTGGGAIYAVITQPDGTWSVNTSSAVPTSGSFALLPDSSTPFSATATDAAGNSSAAGTQMLTIDTTAPDAPAFTSANLTSNTTPSIAGTAEPGSTVTVIVAGAVYSTTATNGAWVVNLASDTPVAGSLSLNDNGDNVVSATATDAAGNLSAVGTQELTIDTTAPAAPVITSPSLTDSITPVVSGTAEPGSTVTLTIGGATYSASAAPDGTWTINLSTAAPNSGIATLNLNGANIVSATATDAVGNMSTPGTQTLTIDTTAPTAPAIEPLDPTRNTTPVIGGQAEVGSVVKVTVGGATYTTTAPNGLWSINLGTDVPTAGSLSLNDNGDNTVSATATDQAGNISAVGTQTLIIDTTAPAAPVITSPSLTDSITPVVTGTAEPGSTVMVHVAAAFYSTTATPDGTWSIALATAAPSTGTLSLNDNGDNEVSATATDQAGNMSAAGAQTLTIDTTAPAAPAITSPDLTGSAAPVITGTAEAGSTVTVYVNGGDGTARYSTVAADGGWSIDLSTAMPDNGSLSLNLNGINSITAKATDPAGNTSNLTAQELTIDTTAGAAPAGLALASASDSGIMGDGITNVVHPTIVGTGETGETVMLYDNDVAIGSATVANGRWSITPEMAMIAGSHSLTAKETDAVGNVSVASAVLPLIIDTMPPAEPEITSPGLSKTITPVITGTADAGTAVAVTVDGVTYATSATGSGTWSVNLATAVPSGTGTLSLNANGANSVSVTATDAAGNSSASAPFVLTIDTTPPAVTATMMANPHNTASTTYNPVLDGGGDPNASVTISEGGTVVGTAQADVTGVWSFDPGGLAAGTHTLVASETDAAGNTGTSAAVPLTVSSAVATDQRFSVNTGNAPQLGSFFGSDYTGPFPGLQAQDGYVGSEGVTVIANVPNVFIYSGAGDDALMAKAGSNVLDGGGGSNWMVGCQLARMAARTRSLSTIPPARTRGTRC